ncbi:unnamed protein product [Nippostrongylus brasiliensis]|uniref:DUF3951 domain-containing protein n=1 Tax=Nippostrongylus brasiliensis TaxID=27835 RepID=A0A0N4XES5_NIPBR|nr:unnamed protein product [Nippostrongylus brasiliensis]
MTLPFGAICAGIGLLVYFCFLVFLDGVASRITSQPEYYAAYSREEHYNASEIVQSKEPPPIRPPTTTDQQ